METSNTNVGSAVTTTAGCKVSDESNGFYLSFLCIQHALTARCLSERTCICVNGKILKENEYEKGVRQQTREMIREINQTSERILEKNTGSFTFSQP